MGFNIGGSASKTKSKSTSTTTPIVPDWASSLTQDAAGRVGGLFNLDPHSLVAPASSLQQQAAAGATSLISHPDDLGWAQGQARSAADTSWLKPFLNADTPFASGGKAFNYVSNYLNPYLKDVVDSSAADLSAHEGQVRAQQALDLAGSGAFGGSGVALTQSLTEGELARARASTLSGLRSHAYDAALSAAAGDADRATQARIANAQTALQDRAQKAGLAFQGQQQQLQAANQVQALQGAFDANQRDNVAAQLAAGGALRDIDQAQRQAPVSSTQQIVAALQGLPIGLFTGQKTDQKGSSTNIGVSASNKP